MSGRDFETSLPQPLQLNVQRVMMVMRLLVFHPHLPLCWCGTTRQRKLSPVLNVLSVQIVRASATLVNKTEDARRRQPVADSSEQLLFARRLEVVDRDARHNKIKRVRAKSQSSEVVTQQLDLAAASKAFPTCLQ
jgi:hypothetical protein